MQEIEHIGIAVSNLEKAIPAYEQLYQTRCYKTETVETEQVITAFFLVGTTKIELLQSLTPEGVIAKFIKKKGEGIHHIAYAVENIVQSIGHYKKLGYVFVNETPKNGADNKMVAFFHPKSTYGILTELCMERI